MYKVKEYNMEKLDRDYHKIYNNEKNSHLKPKKSNFYLDYFEGYVNKFL